MSAARLILEPAPTPGAWNMAVDETLLESALDRGAETVRVYEWSAPTVSLGYFQDADEFAREPQWHGLPAVRRLSGGGAILHDHEVTYSITLPPSHPLAAHPSQLYRLAHEAIIAVLAAHGVTVRTRGDAGVASGSPLIGRINARSIDHRPSTIDAFLCFGRGDPHDIVLGAHKIVGSAQRRRRGAVLQHGSVLLERSAHAPEFPGLRELTDFDLNRDKLRSEIGPALAAALSVPFEPARLSPDEIARARDLELARYSTLRWCPHAVSSMTDDK